MRIISIMLWVTLILNTINESLSKYGPLHSNVDSSEFEKTFGGTELEDGVK